DTGPSSSSMGARLTLANKQPDKFEIESNTLLKGETGVYEIHKSLGKGVYGQVAKCTKLDTGEEVAVKILEMSWAGKREIRMLEKLRELDQDKNNLVRFIEHFQHKQHVCLVFEKLDVTVDYFVRNFRPLKLPEIRVITQQMLVALRALNSIDLSHTDIKPDNIMFTDYRQEHLRVKLIDFGLAAHVSTMRLGQKIQAIGYRAPEVIMGIPLTVAVDMWSLGCLLAFMYLGQNLFPISCPYQYMKIIVKLVVKYAKAFLSLLKRMLCIDPEKRITPEQALGHRFITMRHFSHPQLSLYEAALITLITSPSQSPHRDRQRPTTTHTPTQTYRQFRVTS
uniref:Protein kinase domain-containing protein n=1 Tax=Echeneis naucrates TaxID=173247 RepID=A0A665U1E9_ECHNA